jgi:chemotaxis protein CheD
VKEVFLQPGEVYCSKEPTLIKTILGSCISVCVFDKKQRAGGINHFLLPNNEDDQIQDAQNKYARHAIPFLLKKIKNELGSNKEDLVIKVMGGSSLLNGDFSGSESSSFKTDVGEKNLNATKEILGLYGIKIDLIHVGGFKGRKIEFNTYTGEIRFKFIEKYLP